VPFAGSGTECEASVMEGREVIGFDIEKKYCEMSQKRINRELNNPRLF
jgi:DNA modification methylase